MISLPRDLVQRKVNAQFGITERGHEYRNIMFIRRFQDSSLFGTMFVEKFADAAVQLPTANCFIRVRRSTR